MTLTDKQITEIEADLQNDPVYWEAVREEAEAVLASVKPKSAKARIARQHLAEYGEFIERQRKALVPNQWTGKWANTDKGYFIKTAKAAKPGDSVTLRMRPGEQRIFRLDEKHADGLWSAHRTDVGAFA
ncbi:MAG TPA: hypothetical protein VFF64_24430 [Candidatus Eremiobacteraceae bacterium]|nr:hypothetical protein [Candidatus Eremiobacteraceae bacterium]